MFVCCIMESIYYDYLYNIDKQEYSNSLCYQSTFGFAYKHKFVLV